MFVLLRGALAVWMSMASTGYSIEHRHADGLEPHRHGLGFASLAGIENFQKAQIASAPGLGERHRHKIILGIEFPPEPCEGEFAVDAGVWTAHSMGDCDLPDRSSLFPDFLGVESDSDLSARFQSTNRLKATVPLSIRVELCASALHAVSGVSRT